jgi:tetratricopeptide (TPR) repeat protein
VATVLHNIGGLAHAAGQLLSGEAALAAILDATNRQHEARELLEQALEVFARVFGPEHYEVGVTLGTLGTIDARQGRLDLADGRLRRALAIKEQWLGPDHLELVPTLGTLGVVCRRRGDHIRAAQLYERALCLLEGRVAADHPHVASLQANLAALAATR